MLNPVKIKEWVKKDRVLVDAIRKYNQGELIIDRTIELTLRKTLREIKIKNDRTKTNTR